MKISDLPFPDTIKQQLSGEISDFNPVQIAAIPFVMKGKNVVVSSPTASGKTLIAEIAILRNYLEGGKSVYIVPLKALASEKYHDMKKKYPFLKTSISIGDLDSDDRWLGSSDLIITSNEKMDSLLRHNSPWIKDATLLIVDEIHMLNDPGRGPTLEIVITRLRDVKQVIALSATIQNSGDIAKWLGAKLIKSDYRPVILDRGVSYPSEDNMIVDLEKEKIELANHDHAIVLDTLKRKKQCLLFVSTRKSAEASAEKANLQKHLSEEDQKSLLLLSKKVEKVLPNPTKQCRRLASCVKNGTAFHHAGLMAQQRKLVEDAFRDGTIKMISSTPTLAYGVNLPAFRVLIRDTKRFSINYGSAFIPVMDVHQMMGRAGRPRYDTEGQAIIMAKSREEARDLKERYIDAEPEPIYSKLGMETVLRMHVLALIASEAVRSKSDLKEFFSKTFFAYQYEDIDDVMEKIESVLHLLESYKFIQAGESDLYQGFKTAFDISGNAQLKATKIGKRISELYIDPESAHLLIENMKPMKEIESLMVMNECIEMLPILSARKKDYEELEDFAAKSDLKSPDVWSYEYEDFMDRLKTSLVFNEWMQEKGEDSLLENFNIAPGELYNKLLSAEWLLFSASELAILLNKKDEANQFNLLRLRIKHGVREELLRLIKLKGIGRVRARKLYNVGIKNFSEMKENPQKVEALLGKKIAQSVLSQDELDKKVRSYKNRY